MKIVFIVSSLSEGGAEKVVSVLCNALEEKGHDVHLILVYKDIKYHINKKVKIHLLTHRSKEHNKYLKLMRTFKLTFELKKVINNIKREGKINLITSHLILPDLVCRLLNINSYSVIHNNYSKHVDFQSKIMKLLLKFIYSRRKLFSISKGVSRDLTNNLDIHPKEIHVVYNPIDEQMIQAKAIIPNSLIPKQDYIINVGRFHYQKRQDLLIKAYSKLKNRKKYKLVLIGEGDTLQDCKELVKSLNLENDVIFTGWQSNPYNWIKNACLFVLSSDTEGLPLVLLESLCCGTNIVSTYFEGIEDILTDNLQKNIVTPGNVDMLSKKIEVAINSNTKIDGSVIKKYYANNVAKNYLKYAEIDI